MTRAMALLLLAVAFVPPEAVAHSHKKKGLEIVHPWTAAMTEERTVNVPVYMTLKNRTNTAERLLRATTPLADKVELIEPHSHGSMTMPSVAADLKIPRGGDLVLNAKGPHLLLSGVKKRLNAYDSFNLTLVFERAGQMVVEVMIEEAEVVEPHKH